MINLNCLSFPTTKKTHFESLTSQIRKSRIKHPRPRQPLQLHLMDLTVTVMVHRHLHLLYHRPVDAMERRTLRLPLVPVKRAPIGINVIQQAGSWHEGVLGHLFAAGRYGGTSAVRWCGRDASGGFGAGGSVVVAGEEGVYAEGAFVFLDFCVHVEGFWLVGGLLVLLDGVGVVFDVMSHEIWREKKQW